MNWTCPKCEGELHFDIESPDWDVGITGYTAGMQAQGENSWECHCEFTAEEVEALEMEVATDYAVTGGPFIEP